MANFFSQMKPNQTNLGFLLTFVCIVGLFGLAFVKNTDITGVLPIILATYVGARATEKSVAVMAASKDPNVSTRDVINDLEHGPSKKMDNPDQ